MKRIEQILLAALKASVITPNEAVILCACVLHCSELLGHEYDHFATEFGTASVAGVKRLTEEDK